MGTTIKKILIAPLDWGLGHATRCIPIITHLLERKCNVLIGADGRALALLRKEPACRQAGFLQMPGYNISYPKNDFMVLNMTAQIPKILSGIKKEHEQLKLIIKEKKIDAVISDNRFGLWSRKVPCVFITHQLMIKSPFGEQFLHALNKKYISKYTECWIPDYNEENNLSGDLSHKFPLPENAKYIGVLSRFTISLNPPLQGRDEYKLLAILSGPEPQRTMFEKKILEELKNIPLNPSFKGNLTALIVQGITEKNEKRKIAENIEIISHLTSKELEKAIISSDIILCRSGYSTIMDLAVMGKKVIFVPTPGQTEQQYLAAYFSGKKIAYSISQKKFDLRIALVESEKYSGFTRNYSGEYLKKTVDGFLSSLRETK